MVELWKNNSGHVIGSLLSFGNRLKIASMNSRLVLIKGRVVVDTQTLNPGSLVSVKNESKVNIACESEECILYLKSDEKFEVL